MNIRKLKASIGISLENHIKQLNKCKKQERISQLRVPRVMRDAQGLLKSFFYSERGVKHVRHSPPPRNNAGEVASSSAAAKATANYKVTHLSRDGHVASISIAHQGRHFTQMLTSSQERVLKLQLEVHPTQQKTDLGYIVPCELAEAASEHGLDTSRFQGGVFGHMLGRTTYELVKQFGNNANLNGFTLHATSGTNVATEVKHTDCTGDVDDDDEDEDEDDVDDDEDGDDDDDNDDDVQGHPIRV